LFRYKFHIVENLLTIALPVYKRTDYIRKALDSAVNQTVKCRILLIDNNSPHDDFKTIVDSYNNPLMKYVKTSFTVPQDENFNNCFRFAETPWVTILHDDDMLHCQFVEMTARIFEKYGDKVGGIATNCHVAEEEWEGIHQRIDLTDDVKLVKAPYFYFSQLTPFPGVVLDKDLALKIGGFKSELHPIADFDFWYRYSITTNMLYVDQEMSYYRISPLQSTNHLIDAMVNNVYQYRQKLIRAGRFNNFLTRLTLEASRINNIKFFKRTYPNIPIPTEFANSKSLKRAEFLLKNRYIRYLIRKYRLSISFGKI
jgi:glycosyltransferase involved in cell wall biosynthesis